MEYPQERALNENRQAQVDFERACSIDVTVRHSGEVERAACGCEVYTMPGDAVRCPAHGAWS